MGLFGSIWKNAKKLGSSAAKVGSTVLPVNLADPRELAKVGLNPMYAFHRSKVSKAGARAISRAGIPTISEAAAAHLKTQGMLERLGHQRATKSLGEAARFAAQHRSRIPTVPVPPAGAKLVSKGVSSFERAQQLKRKAKLLEIRRRALARARRRVPPGWRPLPPDWR